MRNFELPGRSPVHGGNAMAATPNPFATLTAINTLNAGGNAIDAAIAAAAVLAVVEPHQTGIGGDCFTLFSPRGGRKLIGYNGSGAAPCRASLDWYLERGVTEIASESPHAVTIPGCIEAWDRLVVDHGSKPLEELLQPAIKCAEEGFFVHSRTAFDWALEADRVKRSASAAPVFLPSGRTPKAGQLFRQPQLAETLRRIGKFGKDGFYVGPVAEEMVSTLHSLGGLHTLDDFANCQGNYVDPISTSYRGHTVCELPPNTQGIAALLMLNILQGYEIGDLEPHSAERLHLEIEAGRLAYKTRDENVADAPHCDDIVGKILDPTFANDLRAKIDPERKLDLVEERQRNRTDTVYLCVVDRDMNMVSFINSLYHSFGSCIFAPKSGVLLQSRGAAFRLDPDSPNCIGSGKRPMHTIIPGMGCNNERAVMPFGVMGGDFQPFGHVHFLSNLFDFSFDLQEALDQARVFHTGLHLEVERGVPEETVKLLRSLGHTDIMPPREPLGGGQAIHVDWDRGCLTGASDPRMDGCALGY